MKKCYYGGSILTMEGSVPTGGTSPRGAAVEAVLTEDGLIRAVGTVDALRRLAPDAQPVNLDGHTLMPAFVDAHSHFSQVAAAFLQVPLEEADSLEDVRARVQAFIRQNAVPEGCWVLARGFAPERLTKSEPLTLDLLDRCAPQHPLVIQHQSGHLGWLNRCALKKLQLTPDTPCPEGGRIGCQDGALTGQLEESAFMTFLKQVPPPEPAQLLHAYERAQQEYASFGIATVQEGMLVVQMLPMLRALLDARLLRLDLVGYAEPGAYDAFAQAFPASVGAYDRHFKLGGLKIFLDGSPQAKTAWLREPYEGTQSCGYGTLPDSAVKAAMRQAAQLRTQLLAHCNGDAAAAQFLACLSEAEQEAPRLHALRPVMIHAQLLGRDQLAEVRRLGVMPSFFTAHTLHWGDVHRQNLGARAERISPAASALRENIRFTFHQDAPVIRPDMLETIWCAVNRRTRSGVVLGQDERIPVYEALRAVTLHSAYQAFEEAHKGSIAPGKDADFVILSENPLRVPPEELRRIRVLQTIKRDEVLYSAGTPPTGTPSTDAPSTGTPSTGTPVL